VANTSLKHLPPEDKKMYMVVIFGAGAMGLGVAADALPALSAFLVPVAVFCAVAFVVAFIGPAEKLFPLRSLPHRLSPLLGGWVVYLLKVLLFFAGISAVLYLLSRLVRSLAA
jgi:hypothetical protein